MLICQKYIAQDANTFVRIRSLVLKLTLTQYKQTYDVYQINFIEFIIALSRYALFCHLSTESTESHSHVTIDIYSEHD